MQGLWIWLGVAAASLLFELVMALVWWLVRPAVLPIIRPVARWASRMLNGRTVALLWLAALASYACLPYSLNASSAAVRWIGFVAFMGITPLALLATIEWRCRRARGRGGPFPVRGGLWVRQE